MGVLLVEYLAHSIYPVARVSLDQPHLEPAHHRQIPRTPEQTQDLRDVGPRLGVGRNAAEALHRPRTGVIAGKRERHLAPEALEQIAHQMGLSVDGRDRVVWVAQAVRVGGAGHELGDALGARWTSGERVESRLGVELGREEVHGHVPPERRPGDGVMEAGRYEGRQAMVDAAVVPARRLPRAAVVLSRMLAVAGVGPEPEVPPLPFVPEDEAESAVVR